jgi:hypothetical protein
MDLGLLNGSQISLASSGVTVSTNPASSSESSSVGGQHLHRRTRQVQRSQSTQSKRSSSVASISSRKTKMPSLHEDDDDIEPYENHSVIMEIRSVFSFSRAVLTFFG